MDIEFTLLMKLKWVVNNKKVIVMNDIMKNIVNYIKVQNIVNDSFARKRSCGKVMCLHLSVSHSVHGGGGVSV